ncbi:MAG: MBL fold metallo-hydrolase [Lachnospiraceae bacterium]|nr:MBL fold metallo-hydrolase [Lachnospiraceae bacterium]
MNIERYISNYLQSNMYIISEEYEGRKSGILIDPSEMQIDLGFNVDYIILTHEHYDHISGVNYWKEQTGAKAIGSYACKLAALNAKKNMSHYFASFCELQTWVKIESDIETVDDYNCEIDEGFLEDTTIDWQGHKIHLFSSPGHSPGSIGILIDDAILFSGDSLIKDFPTECRFPGGSREKWYEESSKKYLELNCNIIVYPGHFESFLLKDYVLL